MLNVEMTKLSMVDSNDHENVSISNSTGSSKGGCCSVSALCVSSLLNVCDVSLTCKYLLVCYVISVDGF